MRAAQAAQRTRDRPRAVLSDVQQSKSEYLKNMMLVKVEELRAKQGWPMMNEAERQYAENKVCKHLRGGKVTSADLRLIATESYTHVKPKPPASEVHTAVSAASRAKSSRLNAKHGRRQDGASGVSASELAGGKSEVSTHLLQLPQHRSVQSRKLLEDTDQDMWAKMCFDEVQEWTNDLVKQKEKKQTQMKEQRRALDEQIRAAEQTKQRTIVQEMEFAKQAEQQREAWRLQKEEEAHKKQQVNEREKHARDEQLKESRRRRLEEEKLKKDEDLRVLKKLSEEVKAEQQEKLAHRAKARQEVRKFMESNKAVQLAKEKVIAEEAEMDRIHQQEHLAKLDRQERERADALQKIAKKQATQANMAQQMGASMNERALDDERRAQNEMKRKYERLEREEHLKGQRAQEELEAMRQCLSNQIAEKERVRTMEIQRSNQERDRLLRELQVADEKENEARRLKKQRERDHRREIEQQMQERQAQRVSNMTATERALNSKKLRALEQKAR